MADLQYSFGQISELGGQIGTQANQIESYLSDLHSNINRLTAEWGGQADENFMALKTSWEQAAADLRQVMAKISLAVQQTSDDAQAVERMNASRFG